MTDSFTQSNSDDLDCIYYITNQCILQGEYDLASRISTFGEANFPGKFKLCSGAGARTPAKSTDPVSSILRAISILMSAGEIILALDNCIFARTLYPKEIDLMCVCADLYNCTGFNDDECIRLLNHLESCIDNRDVEFSYAVYTQLSLYWVKRLDTATSLKYISLALSINLPEKFYSHASLHLMRYQILKKDRFYWGLTHDMDSAWDIIQILKKEEGFIDYEGLEKAIIGFRGKS